MLNVCQSDQDPDQDWEPFGTVVMKTTFFFLQNSFVFTNKVILSFIFTL